jgi:small-conductance mechanosensitive channel
MLLSWLTSLTPAALTQVGTNRSLAGTILMELYMKRLKHMMNLRHLGLLLITLLFLTEAACIAQSGTEQGNHGVPLIIDGEEVLTIREKLGPYSPQQRIESILQRLKQLEDSPNYRANIESITTRESNNGTDIVSGNLILTIVTDTDARAINEVRQDIAAQYAASLKTAIIKHIQAHSLKNMIIAIVLSFITTLVLIGLVVLANLFFPYIYRLVNLAKGKQIRAIHIQKTELISQDTLADVLIGVLRVFRLLSIVVLLALYTPIVLNFFPDTRAIAGHIVYDFVHPILKMAWVAILAYSPNLAFISIIFLTTYYLIAFTHFIFKEVERGKISIAGFDPEWSESTYQIARFLIIAFALVMIYPYLPGSGTPAFQQVSIFLGVLLSLGSTGAISHVIAGVFLTYTGAFKLGDRVKIANTIGDIVERTLLATRIRTIKHEYITIPNGLVLGSHIFNYSLSVGNPGLILHTTVTIGYEVPWKQVHKLLIDAALSTEHVLKDPSPFVLQTSLDDFYVSYEINAYTDSPEIMAVTYSELHKNIQDVFNAAGVEITSPHYGALRDGNNTTIPADYLEPSYKPPGFIVDVININDK